MQLIATRTFLDGQGRQIDAGAELPGDYDKPVLDHYARLGLYTVRKSAATTTPRRAAPKEIKPEVADEAKAGVQTDATDTPPADGAEQAPEGATDATTNDNGGTPS